MQSLVIEKDTKPLGFAVVGLGKFAMEQILPNFKNTKHCKVTALVSGDRKKAERLAKQYDVDTKNIYNYENFDEIKDNKDVDIVYIILPVGMHCEYTVRTAKAGKHVLCEKPMANSIEDCHTMTDACNQANVKLMIAYRVHYEPFNNDAIQRIRKGELGKIRYITADAGRNTDLSDPVDRWRLNQKLAGGGSLMDIGIYALNAARYLSGEEPIEVTAVESTDKSDPRFKEVEDNMHVILKFPSGVLATCTSSYSIEPVSRYRVFGDKAWLDLDPATEYLKHISITGSGKGKIQHEIEEGNHFAAELDHMAECVIENKTPKTSGAEGIKDLMVITAAYKSAKEKKTIYM